MTVHNAIIDARTYKAKTKREKNRPILIFMSHNNSRLNMNLDILNI